MNTREILAVLALVPLLLLPMLVGTCSDARAPQTQSPELVAAGWGIERRGLVSAGGKRHLANVTATVRALGGVGVPESSDALAELLEPADERLSRSP
ncbi:MAG: hypothetical protein IPM35_11605 [Myxococcales bacterium]|nr:hypothetical protein [Myxococcales bacterium]